MSAPLRYWGRPGQARGSLGQLGAGRRVKIGYNWLKMTAYDEVGSSHSVANDQNMWAYNVSTLLRCWGRMGQARGSSGQALVVVRAHF